MVPWFEVQQFLSLVLVYILLSEGQHREVHRVDSANVWVFMSSGEQLLADAKNILGQLVPDYLSLLLHLMLQFDDDVGLLQHCIQQQY